MTLLSLEGVSIPRSSRQLGPEPDDERPKKHWSKYLLLAGMLLLMLGVQPSILILNTSYNLMVTRSIPQFLLHLTINFSLLFIMLTSLLVILVRDPGPVKSLEELERAEAERLDELSAQRSERGSDGADSEALLSESERRSEDDAFSLVPLKSNGDIRWCRKCWAPKPSRCHHCSECGRCVLRMDHHCPWLADRCLGARTYNSFVYFLGVTSLYCSYHAAISIPYAQYYIAAWPLFINHDDYTVFHAMTMALVGSVFSLCIGSFFIYHCYLVTTNQTTLEQLQPMLILRYLPSVELPTETHDSDGAEPPPFSSRPGTPALQRSSTSSPPPYAVATRTPRPPTFDSAVTEESELQGQASRHSSKRLQEHLLNRRQRRIARDAAPYIRIYDRGWKENWLDVFGGPTIPANAKPRKSFVWRLWAERILWGGRPRGDGHRFRQNPKAELLLKDLANQIAAAHQS